MANDNIKKVLDSFSDVGGSVVGTGLGLIVAGPPGAILGSILAPVVSYTLKEAVDWKLSNRQQYRVACSATYMIEGIEKRMEEGEEIRNDGFLNKSANSFSSTEEIFEGVLLKCKDQHQEQKIKLLSKIFENTVFDETISASTANQILASAEALTYRKLLIIAFYGKKEQFDVEKMVKRAYMNWPWAKFSLELQLLKHDVLDLCMTNMLTKNSGNTLLNHIEDLNPFEINLTVFGNALFAILNLDEIGIEELMPIYNHLLYSEEFGRTMDDLGNVFLD